MRWGNKPYYSLDYFLREKFGEKVMKITLDGGFTCPNRDGKISFGGCTFCSSRGSGEFAGDRLKSIHNQFKDQKEMMKKKWKSNKYIAYFQAYTNTYAPANYLKKLYDEALSEENVVGLSIGTRPDCLSDEVLNLLSYYNEKTFLMVELGLQTSNDKTGELINRGHDSKCFKEGVKKLRERNINVITHVIFGLPHETKEDMINTVNFANSLDIQGIKYHLLYIVKNTKLYKDYLKDPSIYNLSMEKYIEILGEAISLTNPKIVIHRITGDAKREDIVQPLWSIKKWEVLNSIHDYLDKNNLYQGKLFNRNL